MSNFKNDFAKSEKSVELLLNFIPETVRPEEKCAHDIEFKQGKKRRIEIKTDYICKNTGNIAFEISGNKGEPSGIFKGNFDFLLYDVVDQGYLFFTEVQLLQDIVKNNYFREVKSQEGATNLLIKKDLLLKKFREIGRYPEEYSDFMEIAGQNEMTDEEFAEYALKNYL